MSIIKTKNTNGETCFIYATPSVTALHAMVETVTSSLEEYINKHKDLKFSQDIIVDFVSLAEAVVRVDKRKDYFTIFHDGTEINEIKEAALLAYWIMKFKPITVSKNKVDAVPKYANINEAFAVFIIYSVLSEVLQKHYSKDFSVSKSYNRKIMYSFRFWNLSQGAVMMIAESLFEGKCSA